MQERLSLYPVAEVEYDPNLHLSMWVSFIEIYNEQIYDLLQPDLPRGKPHTKLQLCNSSQSDQTYVKNLISINVSSGLEAYQILQYGLKNLKYAETELNLHSSRSHSIFTLKLVQCILGRTQSHISSFNFCDLAGSERVKKTLNEGIRLKESTNINTSLMVLGKCLSQIRDNQKRKNSRLVAYRESKLTQILQRPLSGVEDVAIIVNINPDPLMFDETLHVFDFSAIAKDIIVEQQKNVHLDNFDIQQDLRANEIEIDELRDQLIEAQQQLKYERKRHLEEDARTRWTMIEKYRTIIGGINERWVNRLRCLEEEHEEKMRKRNEEAVKEKHKHDSEFKQIGDVIVIDSSSDEDDDKDEIMELRKKMDLKTKECKELQFWLAEKEKDLCNVTDELNLCKKELELTVSILKDKDEEINKIIAKNLLLEEKVLELEEYENISPTLEARLLEEEVECRDEDKWTTEVQQNRMERNN